MILKRMRDLIHMCHLSFMVYQDVIKGPRKNYIEVIEICGSWGSENWKVHYQGQKASPKTCNEINAYGNKSLKYLLPSNKFGNKWFKGQVWWITKNDDDHLLAALGQTRVQQLLCSNKPIAKQPAVSPKVTYRGVQTLMSTLRRTRDLLQLLPMTENPNTYGFQTQSLPRASQIVPRMYFAYYLRVNPLTLQGYLRN